MKDVILVKDHYGVVLEGMEELIEEISTTGLNIAGAIDCLDKGETLRDKFAMAALATLPREWSPKYKVDDAYKIADLMMKKHQEERDGLIKRTPSTLKN